MAGEIGSASLLAAALLALYGIGALVTGERRRDSRWLASGRLAVLGVFGFATVAAAVMEAALVRFDFSLRYVASHVNLGTPLVFRIAGLWGALEGSILFWLWLLALFAAIIAVRGGATPSGTTPYALALLLGISAFFLLMMLGPADPFVRLPLRPADGRGLNPLLQNHALMAVHPPFLYLGYVGFAVPYALAMASLLKGQGDDAWWTAARPWALFAWTSLTAGLFLGARWSYDVLGWGGYWGWDPVENAAFLPWLVGTALLHSAMVQSRRGQMRLWNLALVVLTFLLTIFGTFLTRSGVLASVHTFTQSLIGPLFLAFLAAATLFSLGVVLVGIPRGSHEEGFEGYLSREAAMLMNNLVLLVMAFTVFIGTVYPLFVQAATSAQVGVGAPFFDRVFVPMGMLLLVVMAAGTLMRWGRSTAHELRRLGWVMAGSVLVMAVLAVNGIRRPFTVLGLGLVASMAFAQIVEISDALTSARRTGKGTLRALRAVLAVSPQRYYGYLTHLGLAVVMVGIIASTAYRTEIERSLRPGERAQIGPYALQYVATTRVSRPDKIILAATVALAAPGNVLAAGSAHAPVTTVLKPSLNVFPQSPNAVATPAVRSTWREDVYVVFMGTDAASSAAIFKVILTPMVAWIWAGGAIMIAGSVLNLWPRRRERLRA